MIQRRRVVLPSPGMAATVSIRDALNDPGLLGHALEGESWEAWRVLLIAAMGETLTTRERELFKQLTGREREPLQRVEEFAAVIGRRGGKSRALATLAVYLAGLCRHHLARGETGVVLCIAPDQRQAAIVLEYAAACFQQSPILRQLIVRQTSDLIELNNRITIEVRAASFRRLRGPTYVAVVADEAAFWMSDEGFANPDNEILAAVRPGLATTQGPLIIASSPYARRGVLWELYRRHYGSQGDPLILVAQGATRTFNRTLPQRVIDRAYGKDPASAAAEYGAEFRTDIESFVSREAVEACVALGLRERPYLSGQRYQAFVDPSGGSSDSMTLAIGHKQDDVAVLDALREVRPHFSPESVVGEFALLLKSYHVNRVEGDRYAGEWPREQFRNSGITYEVAKSPKSALYQSALPLINSRRADLLDHPRLLAQLCALERRTARGGKDSIDHPPGAHDDVANAAAGLLVKLVAKAYDSSFSWISHTDGVRDDETADFERMRLHAHIARYG